MELEKDIKNIKLLLNNLDQKTNLIIEQILIIKDSAGKTSKALEIAKKNKRSPETNSEYQDIKNFILMKLEHVPKDNSLQENKWSGKSLDSIIEHLNSYGFFEFKKISLGRILISIYGPQVKFITTFKNSRKTYYRLNFK